MAGWLPLFGESESLNRRTIINVHFVSPTVDYKFINHVTGAEQWGPNASSYFNGTTVYHQTLGSNGYPSSSTTAQFGGGIRFPASRTYGDGTNEFYVLRWTGTGTVGFSLNFGSTTLQAGLSSNYTVVNSSRWSGTNPYIVFRYTGPTQLFSIFVYSTDGTLANLEVYRLEDETDRNNGLVFRMPYKTMFKNLCPGAIRFMDWHGGNVAWGTRWEYRTLPSNPSFGAGGGGYDWVASPKYGRTSGTNQYTLASATGMPVAMTQGEIVTCQFSNSMVRCFDRNSNGNLGTISNITNATNGVVTTTLAHGLNVGDTIVHVLSTRSVAGTMTSGSNVITGTNNTNIFNGMEVYHAYFPAGTTVVSSTATTITVSNNATASGTNNGDAVVFQPMPKLHYQPCTVTNVIDSTNYEISINTTSYGAFTGSSGYVDQYISLDVGSRGAYPVVFLNGSVPASHYGNGYIAANDYKTLYFDKTIAASKDSSGNWVMGVWMFNNLGQNNGHIGGVPPEICTALINEVNALNPAKPIHMYFNVPHLGLQSADPDYSAASNYAVKMVDAILNGTTVAGKNWAPLTPSANLYLEYSNETWNSANDGFGQTFYLMRRGFFRWNNSYGDKAGMAALRSSLIMDDIRQAFPTSRIKCILGCQGTLAVSGLNLFRMDGTYSYLRDSLVTGNPRLSGNGAYVYPHDYVAFASYIDAAEGDNWDTVNLATMASTWASHVGDNAAQEIDCAAYVAGQVDLNTSVPNAGGETIGQYRNKLASYSAKAASLGTAKKVIQYEGGWNRDVTTISGGGYGGAAFIYAIGTMTSGDTTISNIASGYVSALNVGDFIYGIGIPEHCQVASKPTSTSITVTIAPTVTTSWGEFLGANQQMAFLRAVKKSQAWSDAYINWMDAFKLYPNTELPSLYIIVDKRWGHISSDSYGSSTTEWSDLDKLYINCGARNRSLSA